MSMEVRGHHPSWVLFSAPMAVVSGGCARESGKKKTEGEMQHTEFGDLRVMSSIWCSLALNNNF